MKSNQTYMTTSHTKGASVPVTDESLSASCPGQLADYPPTLLGGDRRNDRKEKE